MLQTGVEHDTDSLGRVVLCCVLLFCFVLLCVCVSFVVLCYLVLNNVVSVCHLDRLQEGQHGEGGEAVATGGNHLRGGGGGYPRVVDKTHQTKNCSAHHHFKPRL